LDGNQNAFIEISQISESDIVNTPRLDLETLTYRGGTTFSSGVLPKWELFNGKWMVKRQTFQTCDWANEVLVYHFCKEAGIPCAEYYPKEIKYYDLELLSVVECKAVLTKIFDGNLEHYKNIRDYYKFGSYNDQIIDFLDKFPHCAQGYFDMLLIDYIFNQEDRHSKNFGVIGNGFAPLFDSGASLFYQIMDTILAVLPPYVSRFKTLNKPQDEYIKEFLSYGYEVELKIMPEIPELLNGVKDLYSKERLAFMKEILEKRCHDARKIFDEVRKD
jgi:hypothetical protein